MAETTKEDIHEILHFAIDWGGRKETPSAPWSAGTPSEVGNFVVGLEQGGDTLRLAIGFYGGEAWTVERAEMAASSIRYWMPIPGFST